jgi:ABC-type multidrug transport system fused ATPase/permease subunit
MQGSVADRRRDAREARFSHVDFLTDVGIGIAIGMLAGTTGTHGSARGRMTLLAAVIGLVAGFLIDGALGAILALVGAVLACLVISDLIAGASRREGSGGGALAFIVALAALVVLAVALLLSVVVLLVIVALVWLGISRHRRAQRKHAGLRVLR